MIIETHEKRSARERLSDDWKAPRARPKSPTVLEAADIYRLGRFERREITKTTAESFKQTLRLFAQSVGGTRLVSSLTRHDVENWVGSNANLAPRTLRLRIGTITGFFHWCALEGYVKLDPSVTVRLPKLPRYVPRGLRDDQVAEAIENAIDSREKAILLLMVGQGLRAIEVANLELSDVDFRDRRMIVHGKGGHERALPLVPEVAEAIENYLAEHGDNDGFLIQSYQRSYASVTDGITTKSVVRIAGEALKRVGITESGHALRHTFARKMLDAGASIRDVQLALGHISIATSQVYLPIATVADLRPYMESLRIRGAHLRPLGKVKDGDSIRVGKIVVHVTDDPLEPIQIVDESERRWPGSVTIARLGWREALNVQRAIERALSAAPVNAISPDEDHRAELSA